MNRLTVVLSALALAGAAGACLSRNASTTRESGHLQRNDDLCANQNQ